MIHVVCGRISRCVLLFVAIAAFAAVALAAGTLAAAANPAVSSRGESPRTLLPVSGGAEDVLSRAREAAAADRHRDAIRLYLDAITLDPPLESIVALELGHQYTWAEKPDSAIIWYSRYLDGHPGDREAQLGIARALSWAGRLDEAEDRYLELLSASEGEEPDALLALAKVKA
jgi:tetratricopeptide (TPR) repeat protein